MRDGLRFFRPPKSWDSLAIVFLACWPFLYFWPITIGQKVFSANDIFRLFLPLQTELARALVDARLPLWTPGLEAGFPLFAEGEVAALYPPNLVAHLFLPAHTALSFTILFHLAWACIGMFFLGRFSGFSTPGALLSGFVFGFSGFVVAHLQHSPHLAVASWLPWQVLFLQAFWRSRLEGKTASHWFLLAVFSVGVQFLAGFPQMEVLNMIAFILIGMWGGVLWKQPEGGAGRGRLSLHQFREGALRTIVIVALGLGLGAIQLLPTTELLAYSIRGQEMGKGFFTSHSLEPSALTQFVVPFWQLGGPSTDNMEFWGYLGIFPFFLALLAPLLRRDLRTWFFFLFSLLSLALALGGSNPLYQWLYYVPVFNRFRVPARFLFLFTFAAAFLAATAFEALSHRLRDSSRGTRVQEALALLFVLGAAATIGLAYVLPPESWAEIWRWLPSILAVSSGGTILAAALGRISQSMFKVLALGLTILDLTAFAIPFVSGLNVMSPPASLIQVPRTVRTMDSGQSVYRVFSNKFSSFSLSLGAVRAALMANLSLQYGKEGVAIYAPLSLERNEQYIAEMSLPMRNLLNVRYYVLPIETAPPGEPSPLDDSEPEGGLTMRVLGQQPQIPPTRVTRLVMTSYTDQTEELPDGFLAGEIILRMDSGEQKSFPIRLGIETSEWAYDGIAELRRINHAKPARALAFPAYLQSVGHEFEGRKYRAVYEVTSSNTATVVTAVGARSFLPEAALTIEHISVIDDTGQSVSLASLLGRNDLALAFRSHTAAMWENRDVLPRAFLVHEAEIVSDEQVLARMKEPNFRPDRKVFLNEGQPLGTVGAAAEGTTDQVAIAEYKPERVVVSVNAEETGYLVLTDSWYPGWYASVDGKPSSIYRADYIFRAVPVEAGRHIVVFEYRPSSLAWGAVIGGLSILVCSAWAVIVYFRR